MLMKSKARKSGGLLVEDSVGSALSQDDIESLDRNHGTIGQGGSVDRAQVEDDRADVLEQDSDLTRLVFAIQLDFVLELELKRSKI